MSRTKRENITALFALIFFFSGAAALGCQVVWAKAFAATLGSEWPAVLAVVTAFMSGMAIGNFLFMRVQTVWWELVRGVGSGDWILDLDDGVAHTGFGQSGHSAVGS